MGAHITRLDEIPDEELATLARRGLNSLWLIGVWERSRASKTIKQLCGNHGRRGLGLFALRLSRLPTTWAARRPTSTCATAPIVTAFGWPATWCPTTWASTRPGWSSIRSGSSRARIRPIRPTASTGPISRTMGAWRSRSRTTTSSSRDAAVVFRRRDQASGETRYIYHGNDGTSFPWNDTAQLDYLNRGGARAGDPDHSARGAAVSGDPL